MAKVYRSMTVLITLLHLATARPAFNDLRGTLPVNIDYCKKPLYQDCVFGITRDANDCITLSDHYPLMSIKFSNKVQCQIFTDKKCGADFSMRYVRLEEQIPDLTTHNEAIGGYFQSLRCAGEV
ncbi:hypothetical protein FKW77_006700 [Venturia effusa]|uniref:Uncharacterized protein n=1 Tax=Venturia effusa TaxID=50376 RepID=A0A517LFR8_9PEZI|nr:hypothetical protein FKW77_006700 [Venturia effusa]